MDYKQVPAAARLGLTIARTALKLSTRLAREVISVISDELGSRAGSNPPPSTPPRRSPSPGAGQPPATPTPPAPSRTAATEAAPAGATADTPHPSSATPAPPEAAPEPPVRSQAPAESAPSAAPDTALTPAEDAAKTMDDRDEVVGEYAEAGAEDGAGAQIHVDAPWMGYDTASAQEVVARISGLDGAQLSMVELYEQTHKNRKTVLAAAARRLQRLTSTGPN